jgi:hypothetical protein
VLGLLTTGRWARATADDVAARLTSEVPKVPISTP